MPPDVFLEAVAIVAEVQVLEISSKYPSSFALRAGNTSLSESSDSATLHWQGGER